MALASKSLIDRLALRIDRLEAASDPGEVGGAAPVYRSGGDRLAERRGFA
jgi:hypothetical protein